MRRTSDKERPVSIHASVKDATCNAPNFYVSIHASVKDATATSETTCESSVFQSTRP